MRLLDDLSYAIVKGEFLESDYGAGSLEMLVGDVIRQQTARIDAGLSVINHIRVVDATGRTKQRREGCVEISEVFQFERLPPSLPLNFAVGVSYRTNSGLLSRVATAVGDMAEHCPEYQCYDGKSSC